MYGDFNSSKAIAKFTRLVKEINLATLCTELTKATFNSELLKLQDVDDDGNLWFITESLDFKNFTISKDDHVRLFFSNTLIPHSISIYGKIKVYTEKTKINDLWTPIALAWKEKMQMDQSLSIIKIMPSNAYYWDNKSEKTITLLDNAI